MSCPDPIISIIKIYVTMVLNKVCSKFVGYEIRIRIRIRLFSNCLHEYDLKDS